MHLLDEMIKKRLIEVFFQKGPCDNKQTMFEMMAQCLTGDKPLLEPMMA